MWGCEPQPDGTDTVHLEPLGAARHWFFFPPHKNPSLITPRCWWSVAGAQRLSVYPCKKKGAISEAMALTLSHLLPSFSIVPWLHVWHGEGLTNVWAGTALCKQMDMSVHIPLTLTGKKSGCECPNYCWFRACRYIIERMLQSLVQFWSRISTTKGNLWILLESAVREESEQGDAPSVAFCGMSLL